MENPNQRPGGGQNEPGRQGEGDIGTDPRRTRERENDDEGGNKSPNRNPGQSTPKTG